MTTRRSEQVLQGIETRAFQKTVREAWAKYRKERRRFAGKWVAISPGKKSILGVPTIISVGNSASEVRKDVSPEGKEKGTHLNCGKEGVDYKITQLPARKK